MLCCDLGHGDRVRHIRGKRGPALKGPVCTGNGGGMFGGRGITEREFNERI
ncbi:hypothetical protein D3C85_1488480 [compost metagenome]